MSCEIILVIHALTQWNLDGRVQGHTDTPLNSDGRRMAEMLADRLKSMTIDAVYSSDLRRAYETVEPFARMRDMTIHKDMRLRERRWAHQEWKSEYPVLPFPRESENDRDVQERMVDVMVEIAKKHEGERVLVASHGKAVSEFINYVHKQMGAVSDLKEEWVRTALNRFLYADGVWSYLDLNDYSHIIKSEVKKNTQNAG